VEKVSLKTKPHPKPYNLRWIKDDHGILIEQISISISLGNYQDKILCNIVSMEVGHLHGRPWQYVMTQKIVF